jgi:predicted nucleotidyltransferase component of viral defense system
MTQPQSLPSGPWEILLPQALRLIDEISAYGQSDPFFTFGGGTVLMLRHNHRMSKDIDIFVSDPQSLNYVNPRLCDLADELCDSQYQEAANFIKLQLREGEIDFVASPNLLPDEYAFENWHLMGRSVRVETAAEIVAKKMFHRGNTATARDLYDLAMVLELAPGELVHAEDFMYRHLEAFLANLRGASEKYVLQFESIDTLNYVPSFEHAKTIVEDYLEGLQRMV